MSSLSPQQLSQLMAFEKWIQITQENFNTKQCPELPNSDSQIVPTSRKPQSQLNNKNFNNQLNLSLFEKHIIYKNVETEEKSSNSSSYSHILGGRKTQEDTIHSLEETLPNDGGIYRIEAVYDGHAGNDVSKWMETHALSSIHEEIFDLLEKINVPLNGHHLANTLQKVQEKWLSEMPITLNGGCTTTILFYFYKLNATASLIVGDGRVYMYDKNGNIPELEQWIFDGDVYYHHHNVRHITKPCLTRLQVFTGPIFAKNGEPQHVGTPIDLVNFDNYYSSVSEDEFYEWKTYLLSKNSNPLQILQFPRNVRGKSWRIPNQIEPTRAHAPDPKSGGEIAMRFGEVTWTDLPHDKTINDYSFVVGCDGLEDMDALNPQIIANLLCDHKQEFQNYYDNHRILCHPSLETPFSKYEKKHPRPPIYSPLSKKLDWVLSSANGLGPLSTILDAQWIRSIKEARDTFYEYEQGNITMTMAEIIAQYAAARFTSDNVSVWVNH